MRDRERVGFGDVGCDGGLIFGPKAVAEGIAGLSGGVMYAVDVVWDTAWDVGGGGGGAGASGGGNGYGRCGQVCGWR